MKRLFLVSMVVFSLWASKPCPVLGQMNITATTWKNTRELWMRPGGGSWHDSIPAPGNTAINYWSPIADMLAINMTINRYDVYVRNRSWAKVTPDSWWANMRSGFLTDGDGFSTNWFGHPYHGSLFYNSARLHGVPYSLTFPYILGGSLMWEYFGETEPPSEIDVFTTSLGGLFLGEATYRLADYLWNYPKVGGKRWPRSVAATVINPVAALHRYALQRPIPLTAQSYLPVSVQVLSGVTIPSGMPGQINTGLMVQADLVYGQKMHNVQSHFQPFDAFDIHAWIHFSENEKGTVVPYFNLMSQATILSTKVLQTSGYSQMVSLSQHYDFIHNDVFKIGSVVVTGDWDVVRKFDKGAIALSARLGLVLFGSGNSEQVTPVYPDIFPYFERDYIYGQGYLGEVECAAAFGNAGSFSGSLHHFIIYSKAEPAGRENLTFSRCRYLIPVSSKISAGIQYDYYFRNAGYYLTKGYITQQKGHQEMKLIVGYAL